MSSAYIHKLISQGEHQQQDFKFRVDDSRKIARTLVAFANTDGGKLLIGVKDNGVIAGIRTDEEYYMIEAAAGLYCRPEVDFASRQWNLDGKRVLEIDVPRARIKPVFAQNDQKKWRAYVRVRDKNILASTILIKYWNRKNSHSGTLIRYSENEKALLNYLNENPYLTLGRYCQLVSLPRFAAEKIVVDLMVANLIEMGQDDKQVWFRLKDPTRIEDLR
jgi:predicted HTH transcriptional regulator